MEGNVKKIVMTVLPLILALASMFAVTPWATSPSRYEGTIRSLDEKKETVMELTAASTAVSVAITLLPDDAATPVAEKLADLSAGFLIVLCALFLEKYLLTVMGYAAFLILIPLACVLFSINVYWEKDYLRLLSAKLLLFGLTISIVVPVSVWVSDRIEATYQASITAAIDSARDAADDLGQLAEEESEGAEGFFSSIISGVQNTVSYAAERLKNVLVRYIEALAVMLVTSCVIPILVLVFLVWLVKLFLGGVIPFQRK